MTGWIWVIVIVFLVVRALASLNRKTSAQGDQSQPRLLTRGRSRSSPEDSWLSDRSGADRKPMGQLDAAWAPPSQPGPPNAGWVPAWQPSPPPAPAVGWQDRLAAELEEQISSLTPGASPPGALAPPQGMSGVGEFPAPPATSPNPPTPVVVAAAAAVTAESALTSAPPLTSFTHDRSDIGSAALESTLDSRIESSLFGLSPGPTTQSVLPGAATARLPAEIEGTVIAFMVAGQEVAAVRFLCDELDMGIFDALRTAREAAGLPIS